MLTKSYQRFVERMTISCYQPIDQLCPILLIDIHKMDFRWGGTN
jgi:hypothetical protein